MAGTINLRYGSTDVPLPLPMWGYKTTIAFPFSLTKLGNGKYSKWDNGANYDRRYFSCSWLLQKINAESLINIFKDVAKGRGAIVTIKLGSVSCGLYPFGVDKGCNGDFQAVLKSIKPNGSMGHPADLMQIDCEFIFVGSYPAYSIPAKFNEGNLTIGTIDGLRWPEPMHVQDITYKVNVADTMNYSAYINDKSATADIYETQLQLELLGQNMARLINFLAGEDGRANLINITPPSNTWMFGIEKGSTSTYSCMWLDITLEITHNNHDSFFTNLNFGLEA